MEDHTGMDQFDAFKAMGEFWARAATGFIPGNSLQQGWTGWPGFAQPDLAGLKDAQAALAQSWTAASTLSKSLTDGLRGAGGAGGLADPTVGAVLARIFDPQVWLGGTAEFDTALNRLAEGPQLADLWQTERRFGVLFTAWAALRRAQSRHQAVMLDAWTRAAGTFAQDANGRAARGESFASARDMMQCWIETANAVLLDVQRSDAFLQSQRDVLKASTELRLAQQDIATFTSEFYGQPTRGELDDVHRSLTDLRREVRAMRRLARPPRVRRQDAGTEREVAHG